MEIAGGSGKHWSGGGCTLVPKEEIEHSMNESIKPKKEEKKRQYVKKDLKFWENKKYNSKSNNKSKKSESPFKGM